MSAIYNDMTVPFGTFLAKIYRTQATPASLGSYLVESWNVTEANVGGDRPNTDGSENGFWIVIGKKEGTAVFQRSTAATPTLQPGDFFKTTYVTVDNAGAAVAEYYVIVSVDNPQATTDYRKQTATVRLDRNPPSSITSITVS
jgi:hypothetical protein